MILAFDLKHHHQTMQDGTAQPREFPDPGYWRHMKAIKQFTAIIQQEGKPRSVFSRDLAVQPLEDSTIQRPPPLARCRPS
jgi:hypothetical protein